LTHKRKIFVMQPSCRAGETVGETPQVDIAAAHGSGPHAATTPSSRVIVLLAAGSGSRFSGATHKLSAVIGPGETDAPTTVIGRSLASALASQVGPVVVVTGADRWVVPTNQVDSVIVCHNERWHEGQITSVRAGIDVARSLGALSVVVGLADQPFIEPSAWRSVAEAVGPIAVATYAGRRANPVKLDAEVWDLLPLTGDEGARSVMRVRPELVVEVACTGSPADIDTKEDLRRWQSN